MAIIKNMRVTLKLWLIILPAVLSLAGLLIFFIFRTNEIEHRSKTTLYDEVFVSTAAIINADRDFYQAAVAEKSLVLDYTLTSSAKAALIKDFDDNVGQVEERITGAIDNIRDNPVLYAQFQHADTGTTLEKAYSDFMQNFNNWREAYNVTTNSGDYYGQEKFFGLARDSINSMTEILEAYALSESAILSADVRSDNLTSAAVISAIILLILALSLLIMSYFRGSIRYITSVTRRIAEGELSMSIDKKRISKDEIGQLCAATDRILVQLNNYVGYIDEITSTVNAMSDGDMRVRLKRDYAGQFAPIKEAFHRLSETMGVTLSTILTSSEQVSSGASAIASGAQALAHGTEEQAGAVERLSETIEHVTAESLESAEKAVVAAGSMNQTLSKLEESTSYMTSMQSAMNSISETSDRIRSIIKLIDDIAFQTNILALNAAVEAARAGQYGKGFAVVAAEVKNLAAKSAEAANRTSDLIGSSITSIKEGISITNATADALSVVSEQINDVNGIFTAIAAASRTQAEAMKEIKTGIARISDVVLTNSATAEQSASASQELSGQAELLLGEALRFRLDDQDTVVPALMPAAIKR
jgi:methyl-accepting chemotaxis protein